MSAGTCGEIIFPANMNNSQIEHLCSNPCSKFKTAITYGALAVPRMDISNLEYQSKVLLLGTTSSNLRSDFIQRHLFKHYTSLKDSDIFNGLIINKKEEFKVNFVKLQLAMDPIKDIKAYIKRNYVGYKIENELELYENVSFDKDANKTNELRNLRKEMANAIREAFYELISSPELAELQQKHNTIEKEKKLATMRKGTPKEDEKEEGEGKMFYSNLLPDCSFMIVDSSNKRKSFTPNIYKFHK